MADKRRGSTNKIEQKASNENRQIRGKKKSGNQKKSKKFLKIFGALVVVGILLLILLFSYYWTRSGDIEAGSFWKATVSTKIFDRNKKVIETFSETDYVPLDKVSKYYTDGLISTEDERFYSHHGVDPYGVLRGTYQTVFSKTESSGASTITMQLAKLLYLSGHAKVDAKGNYVTDENGYKIIEGKPTGLDYKLKQAILALKIENKYSKDQILENYVNYVEFRDGMRGIENASKYYFNKDANKLTVSEAALLAGMTQAPTEYNPYVNYDKAIQRRNIVLGRMLKTDKITQDEYDKAISYNIKKHLVNHDKVNTNYEIMNSYLQVVNNELKKQFGNDFDITSANADIYTTVDSSLQKKMFNDINDKTGRVAYPDKKMQAGAVTVDSKTGEILALSGGRLEKGTLPDQNYGAYYVRQPGSTSKPIVDYGPALEYLNWSTGHTLVDSPVNYTGGPAVHNADGSYHGVVSIQQALSMSLNTPALKTFQQVQNEKGRKTIENYLKNLGISDIDDSTFNEAYSIGGWDHGTTPLELAGAYATYSNKGTYMEPHALKRIKFKSGDKKDVKYKFKKHKAVSESTTFMINKMLNPLLPYSLTKSMYVSSLGDQSIKTGTSNWAENNYGIKEGLPRDKWVVGYNGDVTTVIWSGYPGKYEEKGYHFGDQGGTDADYGLWTYRLYKELMTNVVEVNKFIKTLKYEKPKDVISRGSYYAKKGSKDLGVITAAEKAYEEELKEKKKKQKEKQKDDTDKNKNKDEDNEDSDKNKDDDEE